MNVEWILWWRSSKAPLKIKTYQNDQIHPIHKNDFGDSSTSAGPSNSYPQWNDFDRVAVCLWNDLGSSELILVKWFWGVSCYWFWRVGSYQMKHATKMMLEDQNSIYVHRPKKKISRNDFEKWFSDTYSPSKIISQGRGDVWSTTIMRNKAPLPSKVTAKSTDMLWLAAVGPERIANYAPCALHEGTSKLASWGRIRKTCFIKFWWQ